MVLYGLSHENMAADLFDARRSGPRREYPDGDPHAQSAVATVTLDRDGLCELRLYPIEFGAGLPRSQSGRPLLAGGKDAAQTLERIRRLSEPFGTELEIQGEIGVLHRA
jgi:hypothetical protein